MEKECVSCINWSFFTLEHTVKGRPIRTGRCEIKTEIDSYSFYECYECYSCDEYKPVSNNDLKEEIL